MIQLPRFFAEVLVGRRVKSHVLRRPNLREDGMRAQFVEHPCSCRGTRIAREVLSEHSDIEAQLALRIGPNASMRAIVTKLPDQVLFGPRFCADKKDSPRDRGGLQDVEPRIAEERAEFRPTSYEMGDRWMQRYFVADVFGYPGAGKGENILLLSVIEAQRSSESRHESPRKIEVAPLLYPAVVCERNAGKFRNLFATQALCALALDVRQSTLAGLQTLAPASEKFAEPDAVEIAFSHRSVYRWLG